MKPKSLLLRRIAAIPAGEKLPLSRFARELNCSASVVVAMVQKLIDDGNVDAKTLRPLALEQAPAWGSDRPPVTVDELLAEIDGYCQRTGTPPGFIGKVGFNHPGFVPLLRKRRMLRQQSAFVVRQVMARFPHGITQAEAIAPSERSPQPSQLESVAPAAFDKKADGVAERVTGEMLHAELVAFATEHDVSILELSARLFSGDPKWKLQQLRMARRPQFSTVARVRALISGADLPPRSASGGSRRVTGVTQAAEAIRAHHVETRKDDLDQRRAETEARHAEHDRVLREVTMRESEARAARRHQAGRLTTAHPLDVSDVIADAQLDAIDTASDRRARELDELASPSSVLRRAQRDWPGQCARVKAIAGELELSLAEAWSRVIGAGIDCLTDPEAA